MPTIKTSTVIGASAEQIWRVLTHFADYPNWNPYLRGIIGNSETGKKLRVRMRVPQGKIKIFSARVTKVIPAAELRWRRVCLIQGVFDRERTFILVEDGVRGTTFIQRETYSGLFARVIAPFVAKKTLAGFKLMNDALKKTAESKKH